MTASTVNRTVANESQPTASQTDSKESRASGPTVLTVLVTVGLLASDDPVIPCYIADIYNSD